MTGERAAAYPGDLSDEWWALIEPTVTEAVHEMLRIKRRRQAV